VSDNSKTPILESVPLGSLNAVLVLFAIAGLFTSNPLESAFAIIQLKFILLKEWKQNIPPVTVLLFLFPWLEISTSILEANLLGISLNEMLHDSGRTAYWLSALGLYCVQLGFNAVTKEKEFPKLEAIHVSAKNYSLNRLIILYFLIGPVTAFVGQLIGRGGSLYQFVTYLNELSVVLLVAICLRQIALKEINRMFLGFLLVATALSFYSLFSSWRLIAFGLFISMGTVATLSAKVLRRIILLTIIFGNLVFLWQGIKAEYRGYITGSENHGSLISQRVVVGQQDALLKFFELSQQFYFADKASENTNIIEDELLFSTLRRAGYLEFFSMVLNKVPTEISHENGRLLSQSLSFAFIPRFLNPNKGVKDDGAKVERYTDFMVSDTSSFSLGHYVEYYIDFKAIGMMVVLVIYGVFGGTVINFLLSRKFLKEHVLFTYPIIFACLNQWGQFQADAVYIYGQTVWGTLCHAVLFIPIYRLIDRVVKTPINGI